MRHDRVDRRSAALREGDRAVPLHDVHRALDALPVVFQGVVGPGDPAVGVREQREIETELLHVARVASTPAGLTPNGWMPAAWNLAISSRTAESWRFQPGVLFP